MTAEWLLQGNSCMQDCQIPGGRVRGARARVGALLALLSTSLCWAAPLFYCFLLAKETNMFFGLAQNNN